MAYNRVNWVDRVVERPKTYTEVTNPDGSKTFADAPGAVTTEGTPQNAENFNQAEIGLLHYSVAFDWLFCVNNSLMMDVETMKEQLSALV